MIRFLLGFCLSLMPFFCIADDAVPTTAAVPIEQQRDELMERIEDLQDRIPKELRTDLAIISMKLVTGYCSPYRVQEFEDALAALPEDKRRRFAKELAQVRSHPLWPSLAEIEEREETP